jgi:hypothetical protein
MGRVIRRGGSCVVCRVSLWCGVQEREPGRGSVEESVGSRWQTKSGLVGVGTDAGCDVEAWHECGESRRVV